MIKANQDIRDYMADNGVTQKMLAEEVGKSQWTMCKDLQTELSQKEKDMYLNLIDSIAKRNLTKSVFNDVLAEEQEQTADDSYITKFQIGDRVKIPSKAETIGVVTDIWSSIAQDRTMYEVAYESNGSKGLYAEEQLELALATEYSFETHIDGNAAVVTMIATQGEKSFVFARGHAHIIHDGAVGLAQAVSFAAKRMFESLDSKQENKIYAKGGI